jgi:regulatory protein CII
MVQKARVCKYLTPCAVRTLKEWLSCHCHHHPDRKLAELAELAHIPSGRLKAYANPEQLDAIPATALLRLCDVLDDFSALALVLEPYGYRLTQMTVNNKPKRLELEALDVAAACGHLVAEVQRAVEDGIDPNEAARIRQLAQTIHLQADELIAALPKESLTRVK